MQKETIAQLDYEAAQAEKRDKLNTRIQVWSLLFALVGAFGFASVQSGTVSYVVALFPLLAACLARYAAHSEKILDQVKAYLWQMERKSGYTGYESYHQVHKQRSSGGHKKALRDAIILTDSLAMIVLFTRLFSLHVPWVTNSVMLLELGAVFLTFCFLSEKKS